MINFIGNRRKAYIFSSLLVIGSIISLSIMGLNLGIDFAGGTVMHLNLQDDFTIAEVEEVLEPFEELEGASIQVVQGRDLTGSPTDEGLVIKSSYLEEGRREGLLKAIRANWPDMHPDDLKIDSVGSVIGRELATQSLLFLGLAVVLMIGYITYRFEFSYALATITSLLHNIIIVLGIFSILQMEINVAFVAAILTVFGYSVNDTIVIIDRIRENVKHSRKKDYATVVNESINQNLVRSINTSLTTLFVLVALLIGFVYFIGSADLIVFVVALILGVVIGTYSSIFIASPLWLSYQDLKVGKKRKKVA